MNTSVHTERYPIKRRHRVAFWATEWRYRLFGAWRSLCGDYPVFTWRQDEVRLSNRHRTDEERVHVD